MHFWKAMGELAPEHADDLAALEQRQIERQLRDTGGKSHHQVAPSPSDGAQRCFAVVAADSIIDNIGAVRAARRFETVGQSARRRFVERSERILNAVVGAML